MSHSVEHIELKVGALVAVSLAILVGFVVILGDYSCSKGVRIYVDFTNSGGLRAGAPVKISGVTVGKVTAVELWGGRRDHAHGNKRVQVRTTLEMAPPTLDILHDDAVFRVQTLGVLGEKYVEVTPGSEDHPHLKEGAVVDGALPATLESLIAGQGASLMAELQWFFEENRQDVKGLLRNLNRLTARLDRAVDRCYPLLHSALANAAGAAKHALTALKAVRNALGDGSDLARTLRSAREISFRVERELLPQVARSGVVQSLADTAAEARGAVAEFRDILRKTGPAMVELIAALRNVAKGLQDGRGTIGALLQDKEMYDDMVDLMKDIKRHPWKAIWRE